MLVISENSAQIWLSGLSIEVEALPATYIFTGIHREFTTPNSQADTKPSGHYMLHKWVRLFVNVQNLTNTTYLVAHHPADLRP